MARLWDLPRTAGELEAALKCAGIRDNRYDIDLVKHSLKGGIVVEVGCIAACRVGQAKAA